VVSRVILEARPRLLCRNLGRLVLVLVLVLGRVLILVFASAFEAKVKSCTNAGRRVDAQAPTVGFDDAVADRQADAESLRFGRDEGLEQMFWRALAESGTGVDDSDLDFIAIASGQ